MNLHKRPSQSPMRLIAVLLSILLALAPASAGQMSLLGAGKATAGGGGGCTEATTFLARTTGLDGTHTTAYTTFICGLVTDGIWAKIDALYVMSTQDATTAKLNLKSTSFSPLGTGAPSFTADRGFTFTGSDFFTSGFVPSSAGGVYTLNSAHVMVWSNTSGDSGGGEIGSASGVGGNSFIVTNGTGTNSIFQVNAGSNFSTGAGTAAGDKFYLASRTASNNTDAYWGSGGTLNALGSSATASTSLSGSDMHVGGITSFAGTLKQLSAASFGAAFNSTEAGNYYSRMQAFMTAVGN